MVQGTSVRPDNRAIQGIILYHDHVSEWLTVPRSAQRDEVIEYCINDSNGLWQRAKVSKVVYKDRTGKVVSSPTRPEVSSLAISTLIAFNDDGDLEI